MTLDDLAHASTTPTRHVGLDLGATNLKWAVVECAGDAWRTVATGQQPTRPGGPAAVVPQLGEVAAEAIAAHRPAASVGIGVPGLYEPEAGTTVFLVNLKGAWAGVPVAGPVAEAVGLPVVLINDARAFTLAELRLGAGRGFRSIVGITLGTGVGGGVAIDGQLRMGHKGTAGEIGHQVIDPDGPWCGCGARGCVEAYARADQIALACGAPTAEAAVAAAQAGDARARAGLEDVAYYLAVGIANLVIVLNPERVVIGGGVSAAGDLLLDPIRAEVRRRVFVTDPEAVSIVAAELGTFAGAIGAAVWGAEQAPGP